MTERKDDHRVEADAREQKLAQALRANLRRRKTANSAPSTGKEPSRGGEDGEPRGKS